MLRTRREILRETALAGTALGVASLSRSVWAAEPGIVRVRATTDISVLDPGYMTGGVEIDVLRAVVPRLAAYKVEGDKVGWEPTEIVRVDGACARTGSASISCSSRALPGPTASARSPPRT